MLNTSSFTTIAVLCLALAIGFTIANDSGEHMLIEGLDDYAEAHFDEDTSDESFEQSAYTMATVPTWGAASFSTCAMSAAVNVASVEYSPYPPVNKSQLTIRIRGYSTYIRCCCKCYGFVN